MINFSQRKVIKDTSLSMYGQLLKVTESVKFLGVHIENHLTMNLHVEHIERVSLISRIRITRLNSTNNIFLSVFIRFSQDPVWTMLVRHVKNDNDNIINFGYHQQSNANLKIPLNIIKGNSLF